MNRYVRGAAAVSTLAALFACSHDKNTPARAADEVTTYGHAYGQDQGYGQNQGSDQNQRSNRNQRYDQNQNQRYDERSPNGRDQGSATRSGNGDQGRGQGAAGGQQAGLTTVTGANMIRSSLAIDSIAAARCDRAMTCQRIGIKKAYDSRDACVVKFEPTPDRACRSVSARASSSRPS